jgi:shikimate kinase
VVEERTPTYTEVADLIVDVDRLRPGAVADEIIAALGIEAPGVATSP